jgi:hypothetical protein
VFIVFTVEFPLLINNSVDLNPIEMFFALLLAIEGKDLTKTNSRIKYDFIEFVFSANE